MNIAIIGVGAMGCLFAARLIPFANVTLIGHWPEQLSTLGSRGLTLVHPDGHQSTCRVQVTNNPLTVTPAELVLVLVKSQQTKRAAQQAKKILAPNGIGLTLQNGLGNLEILTAVLGQHRAASGVTSEGATLVQPGLVRHAGHGLTHLAYRPETAAAVQNTAARFRRAGFKTELTENVDSLVWGKLAVNAGINPLTALLGVPNGFLAENDAARAVMSQAANEVAAVAQAQGIPLPYPDASRRALEVAQATATNHSSMWQDILRGATTEIDAICGAVVEYGRRANVPTPVNHKLWQLVKKLEIGDQELEIDRHMLISNLQSLLSSLEGSS